MPTHCTSDSFEFGSVEGRAVVADFGGGTITSNAGALLLAIERAFVDIALSSRRKPPPVMVIDLDATDSPLHGHQEGRFFHGYYDCYCYLPLFVFWDRHLLAAKLRPANIDAAAGSVEEVARIVGQTRERFRAFAVHSVLACRPLRPRGVRSSISSRAAMST